MTQTNEERVEENLDKPDSISIRIDEAYNRGVADTLARVREVVEKIGKQLQPEGIEEMNATMAYGKGFNDLKNDLLASLTPTPLESDKTEIK